MFTRKNFPVSGLFSFTWIHLIWLLLWSGAVTVLYYLTNEAWLAIPWLPLSLIGTAVAFYVGFKNNSAYDRSWEARKIWGAIVNSSRMWGSNIKAYISNQFLTEQLTETQLHAIHKKLIYRHIGWLYALRSQLLIPTSWEHIKQSKIMERYITMRKKSFGIGLYADEITENELEEFLPNNEFDRLINYQNTATQIIDQQSQDLKYLREQKLIDDFRHMELQKLLNDCYAHQGKCERIKKFPLPRQYGSVSFYFIVIFIFLLPFGLAPEFQKLGTYGLLLTIPFTTIVGWVFVMMELVGDYSENPFEGLGNDIPMFALCRTIEIDLREMLGEKDLPEAIQPINHVLM